MKSKLFPTLLLFIVYCLVCSSCEDGYTPKPRGFQRIEMPKRAYKRFSSDCGFSMDVPVYSNVIVDDHPMAEKCWYNVFYEPFNATLHLSYKPIHNLEELHKYTEDSRTMVYKHTVKADEIYEIQISNKYMNGMLYELSGNTATNFQFFVTDSTKNYLRGSLYFNVKTNTDSVMPSLNFLEQDIMNMIESLRWNP